MWSILTNQYSDSVGDFETSVNLLQGFDRWVLCRHVSADSARSFMATHTCRMSVNGRCGRWHGTGNSEWSLISPGGKQTLPLPAELRGAGTVATPALGLRTIDTAWASTRDRHPRSRSWAVKIKKQPQTLSFKSFTKFMLLDNDSCGGSKTVKLNRCKSWFLVWMTSLFLFLKVFCATCCSLKCKLVYMDKKEARVCVTCHSALTSGEHSQNPVRDGHLG